MGHDSRLHSTIERCVLRCHIIRPTQTTSNNHLPASSGTSLYRSTGSCESRRWKQKVVFLLDAQYMANAITGHPFHQPLLHIHHRQNNHQSMLQTARASSSVFETTTAKKRRLDATTTTTKPNQPQAPHLPPTESNCLDHNKKDDHTERARKAYRRRLCRQHRRRWAHPTASHGWQSRVAYPLGTVHCSTHERGRGARLRRSRLTRQTTRTWLGNTIRGKVRGG